MTKAQQPVWRVSLLWEGTVLDTVTVKGKSGSLSLRTGEVLKARVVVADDGSDGLEVKGPGLLVTLTPGQFCVLPAGHVLHADVAAAAAPARGDGGVDSTLLHSTMIGVALQVCVVSALWLAPVGRVGDAGAGLPSEAKRWLSLPGGTASVVGRAAFSATGRKPEEAEKVEAKRQKGNRPLPQRGGRAPSLEQALEAMKDALHPGDGGELRETLGQMVKTEARAPQLGAGVGGLSPKDPVDNGPGSGVIGAGTTVALTDLIRRRVNEADKALASTKPPPQATFPVTMQEVPDAAVEGARLDSDPELDPLVREHLTRAIRTRHNVIRGCYSAWGLAADARRSGRLVVELTLQPNGHVTDIEATTSTKELRMVADCVVRAASEWYLGDGLVEAPTRLAFPFVLQPQD